MDQYPKTENMGSIAPSILPILSCFGILGNFLGTLEVQVGHENHTWYDFWDLTPC